ncbi:MAG: divalent cation tolerance protein CutA [Pseudomonadota bacterium]
MVRWVQDNHPYDVPEVLVLDACGGSKPYLDWVRAQTTRNMTITTDAPEG